MKKEAVQEKVNHALDLAQEIIHELTMDGNDSTVLYSVFSIGCAVMAHVGGIGEDAYLEGCKAIYQDLEVSIGNRK